MFLIALPRVPSASTKPELVSFKYACVILGMICISFRADFVVVFGSIESKTYSLIIG